MNNTSKFYDNRVEKFLLDYLRGNKRTEAAISYALSVIPINIKNILDLGYGIGWSSYEISRYFPDVSILALGLSKTLIQTARKIFAAKNIHYETMDITSKNFLNKDNIFDAIIMIDVYEHIPKNKREFFHKAINKSLSRKGRIILTCPTIYHQNWLKQNNPSGLQPVDENVTLNDLEKLADSISGQVIDYEQKSIWRKKDYFHATISRNNTQKKYRKKINLDGYMSRIRRIKKSQFNHIFKERNWYLYRFKKLIKDVIISIKKVKQ
jgi:cyclopropane fatty-acyl-phospholipid synthase-like methyltransferase